MRTTISYLTKAMFVSHDGWREVIQSAEELELVIAERGLSGDWANWVRAVWRDYTGNVPSECWADYPWLQRDGRDYYCVE